MKKTLGVASETSKYRPISATVISTGGLQGELINVFAGYFEKTVQCRTVGSNYTTSGPGPLALAAHTVLIVQC